MTESDRAASAVRSTEVRRARYSGRWRAAELLWLLVPVLGWWSGGLALGWLLLMVALIAQVLPKRVGPTALARLPAAATVLVAAVSALGLTAGFLAIPWLSSRALAAGSAVAACLGLAVAVGVRRYRRRSEATTGSADWYLPCIPLVATFALVAAARLRTLSSPSSPITWSQMSGDDFSHLSLSVLTVHSGGLDYSQYPYPRGLNTVVGWAFAAFGPSQPSELLNGWTRLWSSFELFNFGLLMVAMAVAVLTSLRTLRAPKFAGAAAMMVLLVAGFTGPIFGFTVGRGFATTIAGGWMLLSVVPLGLAAPPNPSQ
ncbi:MAG: hypothetical protein WCP28_18945, partial [Actinomycetes bacterium]